MKVTLAVNKKTEGVTGPVMIVMNGNLITFERQMKVIDRLERIIGTAVND